MFFFDILLVLSHANDPKYSNFDKISNKLSEGKGVTSSFVDEALENLKERETQVH